jgi:hypothetical protein
MMEVARAIEATTPSPLGQAFVRGMLKERIGIDIPTTQELELQQAQLGQARADLRRKARTNMAHDVIGFLVDNAQAPAQQAINSFLGNTYGFTLDPKALEPLGDKTLQDALGSVGGGTEIGLLDSSLIAEPGRLSAASAALQGIVGQALGSDPESGRPYVESLEPMRLGFGDLLDFDITKTQASKTAAQRAQEKLGREAKASADVERVAKAREEAIEGDSELGELLEDLKDRYEDVTDLNLDKGFFGFEGDLGTTAGAKAKSDFFFQVAMPTITDLVGPDAAASFAFGKLSDEIGGILEDHTTTENGVVTPLDDVGAIYLNMIRQVGQTVGLPERQSTARSGLPGVLEIDNESVAKRLALLERGFGGEQ